MACLAAHAPQTWNQIIRFRATPNCSNRITTPRDQTPNPTLAVGGDWLKIKCVESEGFAIIGYEPSPVARGGLGRLLVACREGEALAYVGGVGTGFTESVANDLRRALDKIQREKPDRHRITAPDLSLQPDVQSLGCDGRVRIQVEPSTALAPKTTPFTHERDVVAEQRRLDRQDVEPRRVLRGIAALENEKLKVTWAGRHNESSLELGVAVQFKR